MNKTSIIAIVGPTASGKSELAVDIAQHANGEIISVDSRQVYKGMDIGSGKVEGQWHAIAGKRVYMYRGVVHHGIDIVSPRRQYSVAQFQSYAKQLIDDIASRGRTPVLCGGTGHWMDAVLYNESLPAVAPDPELRKELNKKTAEALYAQLQELDPERAAEIDPHNPRRLVRALEIVITTGKPVPKLVRESPYEIKWIGIKIPQQVLHERIDARLKERLQHGMLDEVQTLHDNGLTWERLEEFGLEYKFCALYLQNKINYYELITQLSAAIKQYAKRQLTWWNRNEDIKWISGIKK